MLHLGHSEANYKCLCLSFRRICCMFLRKRNEEEIIHLINNAANFRHKKTTFPFWSDNPLINRFDSMCFFTILQHYSWTWFDSKPVLWCRLAVFSEQRKLTYATSVLARNKRSPRSGMNRSLAQQKHLLT